MKRVHHFSMTVIALAISGIYGSAVAADDTQVNEELMQYITFKNSLSLSIGNWSDTRMHEGIFDGMRDDGSYGSLDISVIKRDDDTGVWTTFTARNLGLDTAEFSGSYEKQGDWGVGLSYSQIPRYNQFIVNTDLQGIGTQTQTVTPAAAPGAGTDHLLEMRRDATSVTLFKKFKKDMEFRLRFKNEEKSGDRQWGLRGYPTFGATGGAYPSFVAEPIDSTTQQLDAAVSYGGEKLKISGGYYGSWYDNKNTRLDVIGTAGGYSEMSLPPDNLAHQIYVKGNYMFTQTTRGLFKLSYTHAEQDDDFISTNNNGVAAWAPQPTLGSSLKGEVNTTEAMLGVTARPMMKLSVVAKLNYWDRQDKTPVRIDGQNTAGTVFYHNNPFSNTKTSAMVEGTYRLADGYSVTGGLDYLHRERDFDSAIDPTTEFFSPYRTKVNETTYRLGVRRGLSATLNGSLTYSHGKRDGSSYIDGETGWNNITPIHIADRDRDMWRLMLDWVPNEAVGVQFTYSDASDDYPDSATQQGGLRNADATMWALDADYAINDDWKLVGWYSHDTNESLQTGINGGVLYRAMLDSKGESIGLGLRGQPTENLEVGFNVQWTKTTGSYQQNTTTALPGGTIAPPDIENKLGRLNLYGSYRVDKHSSVRVDLIREEWKTNDWTWTYNDGTSFSYVNGNTQIVNPADQTANFVGVRYTYTF